MALTSRARTPPIHIHDIILFVHKIFDLRVPNAGTISTTHMNILQTAEHKLRNIILAHVICHLTRLFNLMPYTIKYLVIGHWQFNKIVNEFQNQLMTFQNECFLSAKIDNRHSFTISVNRSISYSYSRFDFDWKW